MNLNEHTHTGAISTRFFVEFDFRIGDAVDIVATHHPGTVTGCMLDADATMQYRVIWWNNGERKQEWLYGFELARVKAP